MQIKSVELNNFKGFDSFKLAPKKFNVLLGPNGSGKTSVAQAIQCGINGKTPADHVKAGEVSGSIVMDIEGIGKIERKWAGGKATTKLNDKSTTQKSIIEMIYSQFGFSSMTTSLMSSSEVVEGMFGKSFSEYLLGFLENNMDFDKLAELCKLSDAARTELSMQMPEAPAEITLEDIEDSYVFYKDALACEKKKLAETEAKAKFEGPKPIYSVEEYEKKLEETSRQIGEQESLIKNFETLARAKEKNDALITSLKNRIAAFSAKKPNPEEKRAVDELISTLRSTIEKGTRDKARAETEKARLEDIMKRLSEPVCPISKRLICTTDKAPIRGDLQKAIDSLGKAFEEAQTSVQEAEKKLRETEARQREIIKNDSDYNACLVLVRQLQEAEKNVIKLPKKPDDGLFKKLKEDIEILRKEQRAAAAYRESVEAKKQAEKISRRLAIYKELTDLLSPKGGARKKVLEHHLSPLQDYCNEKMYSLLPKYRMSMDVSNGFRVLFSDMNGAVISYDALSNGEKIRVVYILTDMLNALNNFRILILDNLDGLDRESIEALVDVVRANADMYDHIFFVSVDNVESKEVLTEAFDKDVEVINF